MGVSTLSDLPPRLGGDPPKIHQIHVQDPQEQTQDILGWDSALFSSKSTAIYWISSQKTFDVMTPSLFVLQLYRAQYWWEEEEEEERGGAKGEDGCEKPSFGGCHLFCQ